MCNANSESWEEIRNGFEQAANNLREAFARAWDKTKANSGNRGEGLL
jgi:hypothetical protein